MCEAKTGPNVMQLFLMLNSVEHEILKMLVSIKISRNSAFFRII